jgi:hypothetical protein
MPLPLTPEKALIFRITHVDNLQWLLEHGVCCRSSEHYDPQYRNIGNIDLIEKRSRREVPIEPGGTLSDYVPFYFTSRSPMLLNIKSGRGVVPVPMREILVLVASLHAVAAAGVPYVFTDRHANLQAAHFSSDLDDLARIDWTILQHSDFKRDPDDLGKMERYQAEALVHQRLPFEQIRALLVYDETQQSHLAALVKAAGRETPVIVERRFFF